MEAEGRAMHLPMKVVAGWGSREDLGLMRNPAAFKAETAECKRGRSASGEEAMKEMSSRYWMRVDGVGDRGW